MSTLKNRLQSVLGGEELDVVPAVEVIPVEEQAMVVADNDIAHAEVVVAEHEEEITEIQHDIDVIEERLEDIEENVEGLESMMSGESEWNPGLAMKMYNDARKLTERNFGESEKAPAIDGIESFADATTAQLTIIEGLEDIKERLKNAGTAVIEFFKNLYKSVIAAFVGLFDRFKGIEKRGDALLSRISGMKEDNIKDTIKLGAWNSYLDVDKNVNVLDKLTTVRKSVGEMGAALYQGAENNMLAGIKGSVSTAVAVVSNKKTASSSADSETITGNLAGVHFEFVLPKVLKSIRSARITYKLTGSSKTEGEYKSGLKAAGLKSIASLTKENAVKARDNKFDEKSLVSIRDKAISSIKAAGGDDAKERVKFIRDGHSATTAMAKTLARYEGDVLIAAQKYVAAHF